jgi:hypothetical protein
MRKMHKKLLCAFVPSCGMQSALGHARQFHTETKENLNERFKQLSFGGKCPERKGAQAQSELALADQL